MRFASVFSVHSVVSMAIGMLKWLVDTDKSISVVEGDVITGPGDACPYNWILLPSNRACEHNRAVIEKGDVITGPGDACPYNWILLPSNRACEHNRAVIEKTRFQPCFSNRALVQTVPLGSTVDHTSSTSKPELDAMDLRPSG